MMRSFTVQEGVKGFVVSIGCQVAGFSTKKDLIKAIAEYVNNPEETEKKYYIKGRSPVRATEYPTLRELPDIDNRTYGVNAPYTATERAAQENPSTTATAIAEAEGAGTAVIRPLEQGRVTRGTRT